MKYIFENNRSQKEQLIYDAAVKGDWLVSDLFSDPRSTSDFKDEKARLAWAPVLASLAFGEATAFYGFGQRIVEADDLSTKNWLVTHLQDEAKHSEGFTALLNYLYPSFRGNQEELFDNRNVYVFYGHTHKCSSLVQWLICTQIAEVFGRHCYRAMHKAVSGEPVATQFLENIMRDEVRHITYVGQLIEAQKARMNASEWERDIIPFTEKMVGYCGKMFDVKKAWKDIRVDESIAVDVAAFCEKAKEEIRQKIMVS